MARLTAQITREREILAWTLRIKGKREPAIALMIEEAGLGKVTQQAVSAMLLRVEARALQQMKEQVEGVKARQTDALLLIYDEAMMAWERSKTANKSITKRIDTRAAKEEGGATGSEQVTTHIEDQDGDPRFLDQARAALADIRKIWGIDAPQRHRHGGDEGAPPIRVEAKAAEPDWTKLSKEELYALRELRRKAITGTVAEGPMPERNGDQPALGPEVPV